MSNEVDEVKRLRYLLDVVVHATHHCHQDPSREPVRCQLCEALDEAHELLSVPSRGAQA